MPYLPNINSYLHQSSLLLEAYPTTTRITTKYSLPRAQKLKSAVADSKTPPDGSTDVAENRNHGRERQPPSATLTFKTYETTAGICLKYETNKSAEVGRLMTGLGRLAKGGILEEPSVPVVGVEAKESKGDHMMNIDAPAPKVEKVTDTSGGGGKAKKKKAKK